MSEEKISHSQNMAEFVTFVVGQQQYCIDIMSLREIRGWSEETALPDAPDYVRGVINLRGSVLPIIDLANRLDMSTSTPCARNVVMITQVESQVVGLLADAVSDIISVEESQIQPPPSISGDTGFIKGLITIEDRMISIVSLNQIAAFQEEAA